MSLVHYIFVRKDLPLGVICAQVTHAAGESAAAWAFQGESDLGQGTVAVVLEAVNERHLNKIREFIGQEGLDFQPIYESSEPYANQLMAIGLWPEERAYFGDLLSKYQLLKTCVNIPPKEEVSCDRSPEEVKNSSEAATLAMQSTVGCNSRLSQSGC